MRPCIWSSSAVVRARAKSACACAASRGVAGDQHRRMGVLGACDKGAPHPLMQAERGFKMLLQVPAATWSPVSPAGAPPLHDTRQHRPRLLHCGSHKARAGHRASRPVISRSGTHRLLPAVRCSSASYSWEVAKILATANRQTRCCLSLPKVTVDCGKRAPPGRYRRILSHGRCTEGNRACRRPCSRYSQNNCTEEMHCGLRLRVVRGVMPAVPDALLGEPPLPSRPGSQALPHTTGSAVVVAPEPGEVGCKFRSTVRISPSSTDQPAARPSPRM